MSRQCVMCVVAFVFVSLSSVFGGWQPPDGLMLQDELDFPGFSVMYYAKNGMDSNVGFNVLSQTDQITNVLGFMFPETDNDGHPNGIYKVTYDIFGVRGGVTPVIPLSLEGTMERDGITLNRMLWADNTYGWNPATQTPYWNGESVYGYADLSPFTVHSGHAMYWENPNGGNPPLWQCEIAFEGVWDSSVTPPPSMTLAHASIEQVPEPTSLSLALASIIGSIALMWRRRA